MVTSVVNESTVSLSGKFKYPLEYLSKGKESRTFAASLVEWKYLRTMESELLRKLSVCYAWI